MKAYRPKETGSVAEAIDLHPSRIFLRDTNGGFTIRDLSDTATVLAGDREFEVIVRLDTPREWEIYRNGRILGGLVASAG